MRFNITKNFDIERVLSEVQQRITMAGQASALDMEGYAKQNAKWTDRTGAARNSIKGRFIYDGKKAVIELSGNMPYSWALELARGKRYAILEPTIKAKRDDAIARYRSALR